MENFAKSFDNLWVNGQNVGRMKNLTVDQLLEAREQLVQEQQSEIAALDLLIARKRRENKGDSDAESASFRENFVPVRSVKDATFLAVSKIPVGQQFTTDELVPVVKKLFTRKPFTPAAVSTAFSNLKKDGKIVTVKEKSGATPGIYARKE